MCVCVGDSILDGKGGDREEVKDGGGGEREKRFSERVNFFSEVKIQLEYREVII